MHSSLYVIGKFACQNGQGCFTLQIKLFLLEQFFQILYESPPTICDNFARVQTYGQSISKDPFATLIHPSRVPQLHG
jgi:hypothetical protein